MAGNLIGALESEITRASAWLEGPGSRLPVSAIHGDASFGNVIVLDGRMVLSDFETSGFGPPPTTSQPYAYWPNASGCLTNLPTS